MAVQKSKTYFEAVGRRKTAVARVRVTETSKQQITVNGRAYDTYFPTRELQETVRQPFAMDEQTAGFSVEIHVKGGGVAAQAEAIRHGIARALVVREEGAKHLLKEAGYLRRDPRVKERKKFGLRKARRAPQWSKR